MRGSRIRPHRDGPVPRDAARRDAVVVLGALLVLGVLGGAVWSQVVTPAEFTKLTSGGSMSQDQVSRQFGADAWYVVISTVVGACAGALLSWWRDHDPLLTSGLLLVGSVLAAASMAGVGHLIGPGDAEQALAAARVGARVPEQLDVDTVLVYLAWPVGVLGGALSILLGGDGDPAR